MHFNGGAALDAGEFGSGLTCLCLPAGTAAHPVFDPSTRKFSCVGVEADGTRPKVFEGRASKKGIRAGRFDVVGVISGVFDCVPRATPCDEWQVGIGERLSGGAVYWLCGLVVYSPAVPIYLVRWPGWVASLVRARDELDLEMILDEEASLEGAAWEEYTGPLVIDLC
jgi:hypothetical protein